MALTSHVIASYGRTSVQYTLCNFITCVMSDSENEATVLGKRERDEQNVTSAADAPTYDDQSDEDIGPMPIPSDANETVKKKRKGEYVMSTLALDTPLNLSPVN